MKLRTILVLMFCLNLPLGAEEIKKPFFDFFRKLIEPPKPPPKPLEIQVAKPVAEKPVIPPLAINIMGITGEEGNRVAICTFNGAQRLLVEGDEDKDFKVISIEPDKVVVMHKAAARRQEITF